MTLHTPGGAKEQDRALLLLPAQSATDSPRVPVDRRVRVNLRELELRDGASEVIERYRSAGLHVGERAREQLAVVLGAVETTQDLVSKVIVTARKGETGDLDALGRRDERLRREQVRLVRQ